MFKRDTEIVDPIEEMRLYKKSHSKETRNRLCLYYSYIPKTVASKMRASIPNSSVCEDIVNEGMLALMDCIERFEESKEAKFETYAFLRVRGAALDFLRKEDFLPHRVRKKGREIEKAYTFLCNKLLREPKDEEIACFLGENVEEIRKHYGEISNSVFLSFEELITESLSKDGGTSGMDSAVPAPDQGLEGKDLRDRIAKAVADLNDNEKMVLAFYYNEELKYKEIAQIMEISESRICQIHSKAIMKLKTKLSDFA